MERREEISGFLDVKLLCASKPHKIHKRTLSLKLWRRHWCSITKTNGTVKFELLTANQKGESIIIPLDACLYRTRSRSKEFAFGIFITEKKPLIYLAGNSETESQRWMSDIRKLLRERTVEPVGTYFVSVIDNICSKASRLIGLYGDLSSSAAGVTITDIHTGSMTVYFPWSYFSQFHLRTTGLPEDVKCICVAHTTKEFPGGTGELHLFCLDAPKLLKDLVTRGRAKTRQEKRVMSLCEEDMREIPEKKSQMDCETVLKENLRRNTAPTLQNTFKRKLLSNGIGKKESKENLQPERVCGTGTPRINDENREDVYQPEPKSLPHGQLSHDDTFETGALQDYHFSRRESGVSIASGIYEEIDEECAQVGRRSLYRSQPPRPPPLPPRQRVGTGPIKTNETTPNSRAAAITPTNSHSLAMESEETDNYGYVPMSPRLQDIRAVEELRVQNLRENDYVVMR